MFITKSLINKKAERGATLILFVLCLVPFILVIGYAMNVSYLGYMQGQLQAATDAGAHSGTASLCSSSKCWDESIEAAKSVIQQHIMPAALGEYDSIEFPKKGNYWDLGIDKSLHVIIERGWITSKGFESLEGSWQEHNTGVPRFVIANAVRVSISRSDITPFLSYFGVNAPTITTVAIAQKGSDGEACIAPFALHVCSLLDSSGEFLGGEHLCYSDRIFSAVSSTNQKKPGFFYDPVFAAQGVLETPDQECIWQSNSYGDGGQISDNYGVVGVPKGESTSEDDIRNNHLDKKCPYKAKIGDEFVVIAKGFGSSVTDNVMWEQISNSLGTLNPNDHPSFSTTFGGIEPNIKYHDNTCTINDLGVCGSHRFGFPNINTGSSDVGCSPLFLGKPVTSDIDTPIWRVAIPVIAEMGSANASCGLNDPGYSASAKYIIIGFVTLHVFDTYIGINAPNYPIESKTWDDVNKVWIVTQCAGMWPTCECGYDKLGNVVGAQIEGLSPWGYIGNSTSNTSIYGCTQNGVDYNCQMALPGECNSVRARISCDTSFIPTTQPSILGKARLVDPKNM